MALWALKDPGLRYVTVPLSYRGNETDEEIFEAAYYDDFSRTLSLAI